MLTESDIEIRPLFEESDFAEAFSPEQRAQAESARAAADKLRMS